MNLSDLCEPLFRAVARLNRAARKGLTPDYHQTRSEIKTLLEEMKTRAQGTPGLAEQHEKIELALVFFVDSMIAESGLGFAREWHENRVAEELRPPQLGGDERFFDLLDEALADRSNGALERLPVFYTCLGLGFTGLYQGQPEYLRSKMSQISGRLRGQMEVTAGSRICPETYEHVNTDDLIEPPGKRLIGWGIALAGTVVVVLAAYIFAFDIAKRDLDRTLDTIIQSQAESGAVASAGPAADGEVQP